ncbi:MGH1-like glycoside hydrolase domain-containing protein [Roseisalinus antarcticus]|uniref:Mannosylglycerate hydrolase MGH1-like glycoside hydrolase domain-containing protein n=1 Tax=Roseisalinus antarcticus TaxID=254357 RepID=A0A1Y5RE42_9RHOB|nr:hypothetical protein [Roseisalinus antarcticus]SLN14126.1 hypothetical protein ROA7023_00115 [Roseisalinus antarcticus]
MTMDIGKLDDEARNILRGNDRGGYTLPTAGLYPYQWNWDSAFAARGFAAFDAPRAWVELETLFSGQWPNGMVPHILFHKPDPGYFPGPDVWGADLGPIASSGISQPPVAASAARAMLEADPAAGRDRAAGLFPKLLAWHRWFMDWRLDRGAVCITHPWEAGRDNAPDWDGAMAAIDPVGVGEYTRRDTSHVNPEMRPTKDDYDRYIWLVQRGRRLGWDEARMLEYTPFRVADPTMTFILLRAQRDLRAIGQALGEDTAEIDGWIATLEAGAETLSNARLGAFDARDARTGEFADCVSSASFLCWYAGLEAPEMLAVYDRVTAACRYPVPSHDPDSAKFNPRRYWRGPTWGILNMMIGQGLAEQGHEARAEALRRVTADLIAEHGFAEYFDPVTGAPAGGKAFTWTAAVWLTWARPSAEAV